MTTHWSCSRCMMRSHTVVFPDAVPPATPMRKGWRFWRNVGDAVRLRSRSAAPSSDPTLAPPPLRSRGLGEVTAGASGPQPRSMACAAPPFVLAAAAGAPAETPVRSSSLALQIKAVRSRRQAAQTTHVRRCHGKRHKPGAGRGLRPMDVRRVRLETGHSLATAGASTEAVARRLQLRRVAKVHIAYDALHQPSNPPPPRVHTLHCWCWSWVPAHSSCTAPCMHSMHPT